MQVVPLKSSKSLNKSHFTCTNLCCSGGLNLWEVWSTQYIKTGDKNTYAYKCWKRYQDHKNQDLSLLIKKDPNNCVYHFIYAIQLAQGDDENKFKQSLSELRKAFSLWNHPLVLCSLATVLSYDYKYKESLKIWEMLEDSNLNPLIKYLPFNAMHKSVGSYYKQYKYDIRSKITECYWVLLSYKKKESWIRKCISHYNYLYDNSNRNMIPFPHGGAVDELVRKIRLFYWSNNYTTAYKLVMRVFDITNECDIKLDVHAARICYFVLNDMGKYDQWNAALIQQTNPKMKVLSGPTTCQGSVLMNRDNQVVETLSRWSVTVDKAYKLYLSMMPSKIHRSIGNKTLYDSIYNEMSKYHMTCRNLYDVEPFMAIFFGINNHFEGADEWFINPALVAVGGILEEKLMNVEDRREWKIRRLCNPLCIGKWIHMFFYAKYMHYKKRNYRIAKYLYKVAREFNPFNALTHYHLSILMYNMGNAEKAKKYMNKSKRLSTDIKPLMFGNNFNKYSKIPCYVECNRCGAAGMKMRICARCKVTYYCSRKCQKLDWKLHHKNICVEWNQKDLTAAHKVYPYLRRRTNHGSECKIGQHSHDNIKK